MSESKFKFSIDLNVLNHLGINLYTSTPPVLSELVANCWDADATEVEIIIDPDGGSIIIEDNGEGMTVDDINERYLTVGYQKRASGHARTSRLGRQVMGRKGIGKLSVFSIAQTVNVYTKKDGEISAFKMDRIKIKEAIESEDTSDYYPEEIEGGTFSGDHGTLIELTNLDRNVDRTAAYLKPRLARRFSVLGESHDFVVAIDGETIGVSDRDYFDKIQFAWCFDDESKALIESNSPEETFEIDASVVYQREGEVEGRSGQITGWIGTLDDYKYIDDINNSIVVFSRGKLVHEDILGDIREGGIYSKYIIGEINAPFLDYDEQEDIVTSNRQSLKTDDPRYRALRDKIKGCLKEIERRWSDLRRDLGGRQALAQSEALRSWFGNLGEDQQKYAKRMFGKIESLKLPDQRSKVELYKYSLLAFERMQMKDMLDRLDGLDEDTPVLSERALKVFVGIDDLEAAMYYQIVKGRVEVIEKLAQLTDSNKREQVIQSHLFEHLWLLDASWERATGVNPRMEEKITTEFKKAEPALTKDEESGRLDIRYQNFSGKHVIVELKRPSVSADVHDLGKQISKYKVALEKALRASYPGVYDFRIEIVCVTGKEPGPADLDLETKTKVLSASNARWVTYESLIQNALESYRSYLDSRTRLGKIEEAIEMLDSSFGVQADSEEE